MCCHTREARHRQGCIEVSKGAAGKSSRPLRRPVHLGAKCELIHYFHQESDDEHKDAFWTAEYERLVKHATRAVERARSEEELLHEELRQAQSQEIEDAEADMGGFRLITDDEVGGSFEQENEVVDEPRADVDFSRMIEHAFTLYPARLLGGNAAKPMVTMQDDETIPVHEALGSSHSSASEGIALPLLPKETGAGDMMQLPIPLPSSRQASEAHDEENMYME